MSTLENRNAQIQVIHRSLPPLRILIVEDQKSWQLILSSSLALINPRAETVCASTVAEARQLLSLDDRFDLIFADHLLQGTQTGIDLWRFCRRDHGQIPFMMTSGLEKDEFLEQLENHTVRPAFLQKPFKLEHLQATMEWVRDLHPSKATTAPLVASPLRPREERTREKTRSDKDNSMNLARQVRGLLELFGGLKKG